MGRRPGKLEMMADSEAERRELMRMSQGMPAKFRRYAENRRRLRERPPRDRQVGEAGIERAREAIRLEQAEARHKRT